MVLESIKAEFESPWAWVGLGSVSFVAALALRELLPLGEKLRNGVAWTVGIGGLSACTMGGGWSHAADLRAQRAALGYDDTIKGPKKADGAGGAGGPNRPLERAEAGAVGIRNPSNGCYAIAAMQVLSGMQGEIRAARPRDRLARQLRRALVELFEERDRQITSANPQCLPWTYVEKVLGAVNALRQRESGALPIQPFSSRRQECVWDLTEKVLRYLNLVGLQIDPFTRYKEQRAIDNPKPRYDFASYGVYFQPNAEDAPFQSDLRAQLLQIHGEHVAGGVESASLKSFIRSTNLAAQFIDLEAFAKELEIPVEYEEWDVPQRLAFSFWYLNLWDPFPKGKVAADPFTLNRAESAEQFLGRYTLPSYTPYLGDYRSPDPGKQALWEALDALAKEQGARNVKPETLEAFKRAVGAEANRLAGQPEFEKFRTNPNVMMGDNPEAWVLSEQVAFAFWRLGKFTPAPSTIGNPLGETVGTESVVRLKPHHRDGQTNSLQRLMEQSYLSGDLHFGASMDVEAPRFLPFYFSRFDDQGNKHGYPILPEETIAVHLNGETYRYELIRVAEQRGGASGGHYVSYAKVQDGWALINDSRVTRKSLAQMQGETARNGYGFLYRQIPRG